MNRRLDSRKAGFITLKDSWLVRRIMASNTYGKFMNQVWPDGCMVL